MAESREKTVLPAIQELSRIVSDLLVAEHQLQDRELIRMSNLLQEAVSELASCFNVMSDQLVVQSSQLRQQNNNKNNDKHTDQGINSLMLSTQQMNSCVTRAVVALQFEDILQQMINHSRQRVDETVKLLKFLHSRLEMLEGNRIDDPSVITEVLQQCKAEVASTCEALELSNPAQQQNMKKGDVTLF